MASRGCWPGRFCVCGRAGPSKVTHSHQSQKIRLPKEGKQAQRMHRTMANLGNPCGQPWANPLGLSAIAARKQRGTHICKHFHAQAQGEHLLCRVKIRNMSTSGVEPGLSRPQRDVLTTKRCGLLRGDLVFSLFLIVRGDSLILRIPSEANGSACAHACSLKPSSAQPSPALPSPFAQFVRLSCSFRKTFCRRDSTSAGRSGQGRAS